MTAIAFLSLGLVLILGIVCYYLRFIRRYLKLPTSWAIFVDFSKISINSLLRRGYSQKNLLQKIEEICRNYEKEGLVVAWFGQPIVMIFGPKFVKQILNEPAATYKPPIVYGLLNYFMRNTLFVNNGEKWKRQKKIVKQAFQFPLKLKKIQIVNRQSANLMKTLSSISNNTTDRILEILRHSTLQVIIESCLGYEESFSKRSFMIETLENVTAFTVDRFFKPWLYPDFSLNIFPEGRKILKELQTCKDMLMEAIKTSKEDMLTANKNLIDMKPEIIVEALLQQHLQDPSFSMDELKQQILNLVIAAFDTTSLTLMWCLYLLGLHEEVQERLYLEMKELNEVLCDEDLCKMKYTDSVIRETLRMYTTAPLIFRYLEKEVQCGKYTIPKGSHVMLPLFMVHKNSEMFPEPDKFDPERFMQTKNADSRQLYTATFSEGLRSCPGKADAIIQLKIMIAYIVRNFKVISLDNPKDVEVCFEIMLNSGKPLRMQFVPRRVIKDDGALSTVKTYKQKNDT